MTRARLAHKPAMFPLVRLYARLAAELERPKRAVALIRADIEHVAAVILMLEPDFDLSAIAPRTRYKRNLLFKRGECFRAAIDVLRRAEGPLTSKEVATRMLQAKGAAEPDRLTVRHMVGAVHVSFLNHQGGTIIAHKGKPVRWSLGRSGLAS